MSRTPPDDELVSRQVGKLAALRHRSTRFDMLGNLKARRQTPAVEPGEGGLQRPAFQLVPPVAGSGDPVLVVPNEIMVPEAELDDVMRSLGSGFETEQVCDGVRRVVAQRPLSLPSTLGRLRGDGFRAAANHVAMLGGTAKGGATPKATMSTPTPRTTEPPATAPEGGPLVVVIDTGLDAAASDRTDSWLRWVSTDDTGFDIDPLDLLDPRSNLDPDGYLDLGAGHGTFVAGIITQVEPSARVTMLRAVDTDGVCSEADLAKAICRAAALFREHGDGRGVLNLSLGMESADGREPVALRAALDTLPPEVIVVAAAGNSASGAPLWPAASKRAIGVSSLAADGRPSAWANYGSWVDFSARGEGVVSTFVAGKETASTGEVGDPFDIHPDEYFAPDPYALWTGTSFSTPKVVARLAALLASDPTTSRAAAQQALQGEGTFSTEHGYRLTDL